MGCLVDSSVGEETATGRLNWYLHTNEYTEAKNLFESGFMAFLGSKFSGEYILTPQGKVAGEKLLEVLKDVKAKAKQEIANKTEKLQKVAELLEQHPELLDKIK